MDFSLMPANLAVVVEPEVIQVLSTSFLGWEIKVAWKENKLER